MVILHRTNFKTKALIAFSKAIFLAIGDDAGMANETFKSSITEAILRNKRLSNYL